MADPTTLALIGSTFLTEGIKFLYSQTGEILKRWRDRREKRKATESNQEQVDLTENIVVSLPSAFEGDLISPRIHFDVVENVKDELINLRQKLSGYNDETEEVDVNNQDLLIRVDQLRSLLEEILKQNIRFKGEDHPASGTPIIEGRIRAGSIEGEATAVDIGEVSGPAEIKGDIESDVIGKEATVTGVKINRLGSANTP